MLYKIIIVFKQYNIICLSHRWCSLSIYMQRKNNKTKHKQIFLKQKYWYFPDVVFYNILQHHIIEINYIKDKLHYFYKCPSY